VSLLTGWSVLSDGDDDNDERVSLCPLEPRDKRAPAPCVSV